MITTMKTTLHTMNQASGPRWTRAAGLGLGLLALLLGVKDISWGLGLAAAPFDIPAGIWSVLWVSGGFALAIGGLMLALDKFPAWSGLGLSLAWLGGIIPHAAGIVPGPPLVPVILALVYAGMASARRDPVLDGLLPLNLRRSVA